METIIFCIIITLLIHQSNAKRDFTIDVSGLNLKIHDWDYVKSEHHYLYGRKVIYIDFTLTKNITEFDIAFSFDMVKKDNRKMNIIKIDLDGCASLESSHSKMNFVKVIFRELFRVSNIPKKCPIFANKVYILKNYTVKDDDYPILTPPMEFQLKLGLLTGKKLKADITVSGNIRKL